MLWKRFVLAPHEHGLVTKNGRFGGIFAPGEYAMFLPSGVSLEVERHDIRDIVFRSSWAKYLFTERQRLSRRHFYCVQTSATQIAMVYANGQLLHVLTPSKQTLYWRDAATITAEFVEVVAAYGETRLPVIVLPLCVNSSFCALPEASTSLKRNTTSTSFRKNSVSEEGIASKVG